MTDQLFYEAQEYAKRTSRSMTSLISEAVRAFLAEESMPAKPRLEPLHTFGDPSNRIEPLVDILDKNALWTALDEGKTLDQLR